MKVPLSAKSLAEQEDGYMRLENGLIIQYGIVQHSGNDNFQHFNFKKPFPHKVFAVNAFPYTMSGRFNELNWWVRPISLSTFAIQSDEGGGQSFNWIAFGY